MYLELFQILLLDMCIVVYIISYCMLLKLIQMSLLYMCFWLSQTVSLYISLLRLCHKVLVHAAKIFCFMTDLQNGILQRKVDLYWPENLNEPINYGNIVVEMTNFSQLRKYTIRNFIMSLVSHNTVSFCFFYCPKIFSMFLIISRSLSQAWSPV